MNYTTYDVYLEYMSGESFTKICKKHNINGRNNTKTLRKNLIFFSKQLPHKKAKILLGKICYEYFKKGRNLKSIQEEFEVVKTYKLEEIENLILIYLLFTGNHEDEIKSILEKGIFIVSKIYNEMMEGEKSFNYLKKKYNMQIETYDLAVQFANN